MATSTYVALQTTTVGTATPSVTFTSIPQGYTDLVLVINAATTHSLATFVNVLFNSDSGTNYSISELYGTGSSALATRASNTDQAWIGLDVSISNVLGESVITANFMSYSNTSVYKTYIARTNRGNSSLDYPGTNLVVGNWRNYTGISSITVRNTRGNVPYNFAVGSTFTIYGIAAASVGAKATGGTIYSDDLYYYHVFGSTGTFTPLQSLSVDSMVIAGGGGGNMGANSRAKGGGGGAGGLLYSTSSLTTSTAYTVTIGAGGIGGYGYFGQYPNGGATSGSNSTISGSGLTTLTATGGGYGGYLGGNPATGGSGGGAMYSTGQASGTSGQGNTGGVGYASGYTDSDLYNSAGGGGGAGAAGGNAGANNGVGGNGGAGLSTYSSWGLVTGTGENVGGTVFYAGGGGGGAFTTNGTGGSGGGGRGGNNSSQDNANGVAGTINTGGGGGGGSATNTYDATGGNGGSGIVIIRYAK